ncbi:MAG: lectin like domain-containing protein [Leptothrix sp. (in: b-proteobacteria)]
MKGKVPQFLRGGAAVTGAVVTGAAGAPGAATAAQPLVAAPTTYIAPAAFDLRTSSAPFSLVTPVRDQSACGDCWAFATMASLESNTLAAGGDTLDLSENHLNVRSGFDILACSGGNLGMGTAYLSRWGNQKGYAAGPVLETDDPYTVTAATSIAGLSPRGHVQDAVFLPDRANATDNLNWKYALQNYGALYVSFYVDTVTLGYWNPTTSSYYYNGAASGNHAVTLVGWDDNYPASNFSTVPAGNGAYIVKNSWGSGWGQSGYFYISYYDAQLKSAGAVQMADPTTTYTHQFMYDPHGWISAWGYGTSLGWGGNVFKAGPTEPPLKAVSFYTTGVDTAYTVSIYTNVTGTPTSGVLQSAATVSGTMPYAGYHTVKLPVDVPLVGGQSFSVVVQFNTPGTGYPVASEAVSTGYNNTVVTTPGQTYLSSNGTSWLDMSGYSSIVNIRAMTGLSLGALQGGSVGTAFTQSLSASGGVAPYAFALVKGALPPGLTLGSGGNLTGTPTQAGTYAFTVSATDSTAATSGGAFTGTGTYSLAIIDPANAGGQTITFGAVPVVKVGGVGALSATASSGLTPVVFASATPAICGVAGSTVTGLAGGICTVTADQAGGTTAANVAYLAAPQAAQNITISKNSQSIVFGVAPALAFGGTATLSATAASGLVVSYTSLTPATCSVNGSIVTGLAGGLCTIAADQAGNASYDPAVQVTQSITVAPAAQTLAFAAAPVVVLAGTGTVKATASSGLAATYTATTPTICSVVTDPVAGTGTVTGLAAGTCTIAANQAGSGNYKAATQVTQSIVIGKGVQTITFGAAPVVNVGQTAVVSATASSGLAVTLKSSTTTICSITGTSVKGVKAGTCTLSASQAGNTSYAAAPAATLSFPVALTPQTITFGAAPIGIMVGKTGKVTATSSSALAATFTSLTPTTCTVATGTVTGKAAGLCTIAANQAGNTTYAAAPQVTQDLTIAPALPAISIGTGAYAYGAVTKATAATLTLTNTGAAALTISTVGMASGTQFKVTGGTCKAALSVAAAKTCTVIVTFTPVGTTVFNDTLTVTGTATGTTTPVYTATNALSGS